MQYMSEPGRVTYRNDQGKVVAEITYRSSDRENVVVVDHTYTDPEMRGQGIAEKLLDYLVNQLSQEGVLIDASCPYVVDKFVENPEKYDGINANKQ